MENDSSRNLNCDLVDVVGEDLSCSSCDQSDVPANDSQNAIESKFDIEMKCVSHDVNRNNTPPSNHHLTTPVRDQARLGRADDSDRSEDRNNAEKWDKDGCNSSPTFDSKPLTENTTNETVDSDKTRSETKPKTAHESSFSIWSILETPKVPRGRRPNSKYPRVQACKSMNSYSLGMLPLYPVTQPVGFQVERIPTPPPLANVQ